jgi:hypothetical protein
LDRNRADFENTLEEIDGRISEINKTLESYIKSEPDVLRAEVDFRTALKEIRGVQTVLDARLTNNLVAVKSNPDKFDSKGN